MQPVLTLKDLCVHLGGKQVLSHINLTVNQGEIFALMGPSGSGKTTLLRTINLLQTPSSGSMVFKGEQLYPKPGASHLTRVRRRMSLVFQTPTLFNDTVYNNVAYGLRIRRMERRRIHQQVGEALHIVGLEGYEKQRARTLSGGEAQRVSLARALVFQPELLMLDEPTANLDPGNVAKIEALIKRINREYGTTVILATHNLNQVRRLAHRAGILLNGALIEAGSVDALFTRAQNPAARAFLKGEMVY